MTKHIIENAVIIKDTGKAILVEAPDFDEPEWIPQSMVHSDSEIWKEDEEGTLIIKGHWAEAKGWI